MRYAIIIDYTVINVAISEGALAPSWVASESAAIGDTYDPQTGTFTRPPPPPDPVPTTVTRAQGKAALIGAGLWQQVLDYVGAIEDPQQRALAEVALNDTQEWRRDSPFLLAAATSLGIEPAQMDALFLAAAQVVL